MLEKRLQFTGLRFRQISAQELSADVMCEWKLAFRIKIKASGNFDTCLLKAARQTSCTTEQINGLYFGGLWELSGHSCYSFLVLVFSMVSILEIMSEASPS